MVYSWILQAIYILYFLIVYSARIFGCGPRNNASEWYVMTIGYMTSDVDSIISLVTGCLLSKEHCKLFHKLSRIHSNIEEGKLLKRFIRISLLCACFCFLLVFSSYVHVTYLRYTANHDFFGTLCTMTDAPFQVLIRGLISIIQIIQTCILMVLCRVICWKYQYLAETTAFSIDNLCASHLKENIFCHQLTFKSGSNIKQERKILQLEQLGTSHDQIWESLNLLNKCIGFQLLASITSSLYTAIYYLYRYGISSQDTKTSNANERFHYIIGLFFRWSKMILSMTSGSRVASHSLLPLQTLQEAKILNLPFDLQQQTQTLLLKWHGRQGYISAYGIMKMGQWLLAPIFGNVITYLLVALQFNAADNEQNLDGNMTKAIDSISVF